MQSSGSSTVINEPCPEKTCACASVQSDQHPHSLISTFGVHCLDSIVPVIAKSKFQG